MEFCGSCNVYVLGLAGYRFYQRRIYYKDISVGRPKNKRTAGLHGETKTRKQIYVHIYQHRLRGVHAPSPAFDRTSAFFIYIQTRFLCSTVLLLKNDYPIVPKFPCLQYQHYGDTTLTVLTCSIPNFQERKSDWPGLCQCISLGSWRTQGCQSPHVSGDMEWNVEI